MSEILDDIAKHANIFVVGIIDSISIHKTLPILVNNAEVKYLTLQVLAANGFLLLGSVLVFNRGISPVLNFVLDNVGAEDIIPGSNLYERAMWFLYKIFWLIPICGLCYGVSSLWYQELADNTYKHLKGVSKATSVSKTVGFVLYATLVWACMFVQVQLLCNLAPLLISQLILLISKVLSSQSFITLSLHHILVYSLQVLNILLQTCGNVLMCTLYGWYAFDPQWIAANVHPDVRFAAIERHWAYFLGFGFPFVLIIKTTSFFVGYGVFLGMFPFCIMLGALSDYKAPYAAYSDKEMISLELFKVAKQWTLLALKRVNKSSYESLKKGRTKQGVSTSSGAVSSKTISSNVHTKSILKTSANKSKAL